MAVDVTLGKNSSDVTSYGLEVSDDLFENGGEYRTLVPEALSDGGFSVDITDLKPNQTYYLRAFVSNGSSRLYSSVVTHKTPETSIASVSDVTSDGNYLIASIQDTGGRIIEEVGFLWGDSADAASVRREKRNPGTLGADGKTFSLPVSAAGLGDHYVLAYAEDSSGGIGYSRVTFELSVQDNDAVEIEDPEFERYLVYRYDTNRDGRISYAELRAISTIDVETDNIYSVREIESMPDLTVLKVQGSSPRSGKLASLPTGSNAKLVTLSCSGNAISTLDLSGNPAVKSLDISGNKFTQFDKLPCPELEEFYCQGNSIKSLDLSAFPRLSYLNCLENPLETLYLSYYQEFDLLKVPEGTTIVYVDEPEKPQPTGKYLTFTSAGTTYLTLNSLDSETGGPGTNAPVLYYSRDAVEWTLWDYSRISFTADSPLYIYGDNPQGFSTIEQFSFFATQGSTYAVSGSVMALLSKDTDITNIPCDGCFCGLFYLNSGLTAAPQLPSVYLTDYCYTAMFYECQNLVAAPELPATRLKECCYMGMFQGCSKLNYVKCLATDISADACTYSWMQDVNPQGTFVKAKSMNYWPSGPDGIPEGWQVSDE